MHGSDGDIEGRTQVSSAPDAGPGLARGLEDVPAELRNHPRYLQFVALLNERKVSDAVQRLDAFVHTSELPYRLVPRWLEPPRSEVVSARVLMARAFLTERQWNQAKDQAELVLKIMPSHAEAGRILAEALINVGFARVVAGDIDGAVESFRRAVAADPANVRARNLLALALQDQQRVGAQR